MASRRFKFKPKPVISAASRKPKEILNENEIHLQESKSINSIDVLLKAASIQNEFVSSKNENPNSLIQNQSKSTNYNLTECNEMATFETSSSSSVKSKTDICKTPNPNTESEFSTKQKFNTQNKYKDKISTNMHETPESNNVNNQSSYNEIPVTSNIISISRLNVPNEECDISSEITVSSNHSVAFIASEFDSDKCTKGNIENKSTTLDDCKIKNVEVNSLSTKNVDNPKPISKFGRFKCKPVLFSNVPRRKILEAHQNNSSDSEKTKSGDNNSTKELAKNEQNFTSEITLTSESLIEKTNDFTSKTINETPLDNEDTTKFLITDPSEHPLSPVISSNLIDGSEIDAFNKSSSPTKIIHKVLPFKPAPNIPDKRNNLPVSENEEDNPKNETIVLDESTSLNNNTLVSAYFKKEFCSKKKRQPRSQLSTFARMGQDALDKMRTKFGDQDPLKNELTMLDLIFYNPKTNPMPQKLPNQTVKKKYYLDEKDSNGLATEILTEQEADDVKEPDAMPVPQLKVGPDGQVMLDPSSLVIETTDVRKNRENLENSEIVHETELTYGNYVKKKTRRNEWTAHETIQFYRALNSLGTDFALLATLFPNRTRRDLKLKFKREERVNLHLIDKAVSQPIEFDFKALEEEMKFDADQMAKAASEREKHKQSIKEEKLKQKEIKKKTNNIRGSSYHQFMEGEDSSSYRNSNTKNKRKRKKPNIKESEIKENRQVCYCSYSHKKSNKSTPKDKVGKETTRKTQEQVDLKLNEKDVNCEEPLPKRTKFTTQNNELTLNRPVPGLFDEPWDLSSRPIDDIEANVLEGSQIESSNVSMISDLGSSFVDEINQMESAEDNMLSSVDKFIGEIENGVVLPSYSSIKKNISDGSSQINPILNTRILSESMKIIDQLTSNVDGDNEAFTANNDANQTDVFSESPEPSESMSEEPILLSIISSNENTTGYFNMEVQMPFKIRQKVKKFTNDENNDLIFQKEATKSITGNQVYENISTMKQSSEIENEFGPSTSKEIYTILPDQESDNNENTIDNFVPTIHTYIVNTDGILEPTSAFDQRFETITGECDTDLTNYEDLGESNEYVILEPIEVSNSESNTCVYTTEAIVDNDCILGE
uniref:Myb-like domain-containing protein n=1 Tax=Clastoptera arizonana TaxID=38151 RepID=A0A1B6CF42_9HEMI